MAKKVTFLSAVTMSLVLVMCDHGLEPPKENDITGISGTVYYTNWPPADSIELLKIVFFKAFPPADIVNEIISGNASTFPEALAEGLPLDVDSTRYQIELAPETYSYITVAQQYGPDVFTQWRAVGQYNITPGDSLPTAVTVVRGSLIENINIYVDFNDLPVQFLEAP